MLPFGGGLAVALGVLSLSFEGHAHGFGAAKKPQGVAPKARAAAPLPKHGSMVGGPARHPPRGHAGGRRHGPGHWAEWDLFDVPFDSYDQADCENDWKMAILGEAMNYDNWKCSARLREGITEPCVLTGVYPAPATSTPAPVNTARCQWTLPRFCDDFVNDVVNSLLKSKAPVAVATVPPTGYTAVAGAGFFKVHTDPKSWANAQATCVAEGGNLAVPARSSDYPALVGLMSATLPATTEAYVGITDLAQEGRYATVTGQPACQLEQFVFRAGQPDNGGILNEFGNVDCLTVFQPTGALDDVDCSLAMPFICQITDPARTPCPI